jgi:4'-phosphopantetheinyl transferase
MAKSDILEQIAMKTVAHENTMNSPALQLWFAHPGDLAAPEAEQACIAILDETERARVARFKFERHRREYLATHALTRVALSHAHSSSGESLTPRDWKFSRNKFGKPSPDPECGLRFNQSNSVELTACLIALPGPVGGVAAEVGVDVEALSRAEEIVPLAPRVFSPAERAQLDALPAALRPKRALMLWTLKEAYIKARGMGLSLPLQKISFLFDDDSEAIRFAVEAGVDDDPARWRFCRFDHGGHGIALAVEATAACEPEFWQARPPVGAPTRLLLDAPAWFPVGG